MPSFDALAGASLTPGGVQSGVNDLVAALVNGPIQRRRIEQQQAQIQAQNDFQNRSFGEQVASRLAGNQQHTSTLAETTRHNQAEELNQANAIIEKGQPKAAEIAAREKAAEAAALGRMGAGFTARGKKLAKKQVYIPGYPTEANPSGVEARPGSYEEVPWDANENANFNKILGEERKRLNLDGGVQDITDQLGQSSASPNPGAQMPKPGFAHQPGRTGTVQDLVPGGPILGPPSPVAPAAPTAAAPGASQKTVTRSVLQAKKNAKFGRPTPLTPEDEAAYTQAGYMVVDQ